MKIKPFFKWFDFWVGVYIDRPGRAVYICPLPMVGVKISRLLPGRPSGRCPDCGWGKCTLVAYYSGTWQSWELGWRCHACSRIYEHIQWPKGLGADRDAIEREGIEIAPLDKP